MTIPSDRISADLPAPDRDLFSLGSDESTRGTGRWMYSFERYEQVAWDQQEEEFVLC